MLFARSSYKVLLLLGLLGLVVQIGSVQSAFSSSPIGRNNNDNVVSLPPRSMVKVMVLHAKSPDANNHANEDADDSDADKDDNGRFQKSLDTRVNEIQVERTRQQLEQAHTQSFLKRRPRKLPYDDARIWVQANLGCDTKEEFDDLVANGNLRTPYIPKQASTNNEIISSVYTSNGLPVAAKHDFLKFDVSKRNFSTTARSLLYGHARMD